MNRWVCFLLGGKRSIRGEGLGDFIYFWILIEVGISIYLEIIGSLEFLLNLGFGGRVGVSDRGSVFVGKWSYLFGEGLGG